MVLSMASSAKADMGPKPSVEIRLQNIPEQDFVMALLTKDDDSYGREDKMKYLREKTDPDDPYDSMNQMPCVRLIIGADFLLAKQLGPKNMSSG